MESKLAGTQEVIIKRNRFDILADLTYEVNNKKRIKMMKVKPVCQ